ncbi:MAG TPA: FAD:protein FMN transferase [Pseudonocardiaceae bacterium]|jgi:thiamine biosynthesis lipoprotein|nr:FAD:protein FMN transferase [Pseudonocardiaceae bacterium]
MPDQELAGWSRAVMDTVVTIRIAAPANMASEFDPLVEQAFDWFDAVEAACSRFAMDSEVRQLAARIGEPVALSPILLAALTVALQVAEHTDGAFDPTIGYRLAAAGFDRDYRTGEPINEPCPSEVDCGTLADLHLDPLVGTVILDRPVLLDLGAVAKGLAIDLAAQELSALSGATINAGGDAYLLGTDLAGNAWPTGIADPLRPGELITELALADLAIATSGDYARPGHLLALRTPPADPVAGVTVVAPTAMAADAVSTAVSLLGMSAGLSLLAETEDVDALLVSPSGEVRTTKGWGMWD